MAFDRELPVHCSLLSVLGWLHAKLAAEAQPQGEVLLQLCIAIGSLTGSNIAVVTACSVAAMQRAAPPRRVVVVGN